MEAILNACVGIGFLMLVLLIFKKGKNQKDYLLLAWILVTIFQTVFYVVSIFHQGFQGFLAISSFSLPLLGAPLLFFYILKLTAHQVSFKTFIMHSSVFLLYVITFYTASIVLDWNVVAEDGYLQEFPDNPILSNFYAIPLAISGFIYCIWDLILLKNHQKEIKTQFSFEEKINLNWVRYVVFSYFVLFILTSSLIFGATQFQLILPKVAFTLTGITLGLMLVALGFYGFRQTTIFTPQQKRIFSDQLNSSPPTKRYAKSGISPVQLKSMAATLNHVMEQDQPYLDEDLNLNALAEKCKMTPVQLSQVINQHFLLNFYDLVNQFRVEEAKRRLDSAKFGHLSLLGIAYDCGFKSKSSFNRHFKKITGLSPSEYRKSKNQ